MTTLKSSKTPSGNSDAFYIGALPEKNIGVLNILTCNGGHQDFDDNVAATFFATQNIEKVLAWDGSLSYTAAGWGIYVPRLANDQSHFFEYSLIDRKPKGEVIYAR